MPKSHRILLATGLVGLLAAGGTLFLFQRLSFDALVAQQTRANAAMAHAFANALWPRLEGHVREAATRVPGRLPERAASGGPLADVVAQMRGTNVVEVSVHDPRGVIVFSTDSRRMGRDESTRPNVERALAGESSSEIVFRTRPDAFGRGLPERDLASSHVPIHDAATGEIHAVLGVRSDVTPLVAQLRRGQRQAVAGAVGGLLVLYVALFLGMRRADNDARAREMQRIAQEARIRFQAYHDLLTGLPNRESFHERLQQAIQRAQRTQSKFALLFLDLDRFKLVNDSFGHEAGDLLLRMASRRIQMCIRDNDALFRMSGDEFTVLAEDLDHPEDALRLAERIRDKLAEPMTVRSHTVTVTTSIGISIYPRDTTSPEGLIKNADAAMYLAKESGRNQFHFYSPELNERALEQLSMESDLHQALEKEQFFLHYQPRVQASTGRVVAVEALLRWNHPKCGEVAAADFIPLLEQSGHIAVVGEWVLRTACRQNKAWQWAGLPPVRVSVNVSPRQLRCEHFIESVQSALLEAELDPRYLELELTERALLDNTTTTIDTLRKLKKIGASIAIDDYGTGYSSLGAMASLPVDFFKIDTRFVQAVDASQESAAVVNTIAALAHGLGVGLVAEGVETAAQAQCLRPHGCHELQGFFYHRPAPPAQIEEVLASQTVAAAV